MAQFHKGTRAAIDHALPLFYKAIDIDPEFASAYGMAAWCHFWRKINGWMEDRTQGAEEAARLAQLAINLGKNDAVSLTRGGHALGHFGGDLDTCITLLDRALVLDPNLSAAWYLSGFQRITRGEHHEAVERFAHAMRLSPLDPELARMQNGTAMAHLFAVRYDLAVAWADKALRELPSFLLAAGIIAASHALSGRKDEALLAMAQVRQLDPSLRISNLGEWVYLKRPEDRAVLEKGMREAGLPE